MLFAYFVYFLCCTFMFPNMATRQYPPGKVWKKRHLSKLVSKKHLSKLVRKNLSILVSIKLSKLVSKKLSKLLSKKLSKQAWCAVVNRNGAFQTETRRSRTFRKGGVSDLFIHWSRSYDVLQKWNIACMRMKRRLSFHVWTENAI